MDVDDVRKNVGLIVEEQILAFGELESAVMHVANSSPSPSQRVILCNNLVVGLTARIEEAIRQIFSEYIRGVEGSDATFYELSPLLRESGYAASVKQLRRKCDWDDAKANAKALDTLLSGATEFSLAVSEIVFNQGNMRSAEVTDISKRIGISELWRKIAEENSFNSLFDEEDGERLLGMVVAKWNGIFDERDAVVHRVSQASGWSTDKLVENIQFCRAVIKTIGSIFVDEFAIWYSHVERGRKV